jgi:AcrR family transcriptional regulator
MPKTDGKLTRNRILDVAEHLFSEKGFDAASIDMIAKSAGINKATIYYHFKDKQDIINSLFDKINEEIMMQAGQLSENNSDWPVMIRQELQYLRKKKKILSVLLMESMKQADSTNALFHMCQKHMGEIAELKKHKNRKEKSIRDKNLIAEFFCGMMPVLTFVAYEERWCSFFECDKVTLEKNLIECLSRSHTD